MYAVQSERQEVHTKPVTTQAAQSVLSLLLLHVYIAAFPWGFAKGEEYFWACIYGCVKWGHSKLSGWEPALVQNYASANASRCSADSKAEINRRWKREDPQSEEALEKESNPWDWLHM